MHWRTHDFRNLHRNAFRDDVRELIDESMDRTINFALTRYLVRFIVTHVADHKSRIIVSVLVGHSVSAQDAPQDILFLLIKHNLLSQLDINDMFQTTTALDFLAYAEARPEQFRDVMIGVFNALLTTDEWLRFMRVLPSALFDIGAQPTLMVAQILERAPDGVFLEPCGKIIECKYTIDRRRLFALMIGVADGYLRAGGSAQGRFFGIVAALPMELQDAIVQVLYPRHKSVRFGATQLKECDCRWMLRT